MQILCAALLNQAPLLGPGAAVRTPPSEFLIFRWGANQTSKGVYFLDKEGAAAILAAYRQDGRDLYVDYNHDGVSPGVAGDRTKAAAWFTPAIRSDGLWATDVRWTPKAAAALADGEFRYHSAAFAHDPKRRVLKLVNVALTNLPAMRGQTPLVAANLLSGEPVKPRLRTILGLLGDLVAECQATTAEVDGGDVKNAADKMLSGLPEVITALRALLPADAAVDSPLKRSAALSELLTLIGGDKPLSADEAKVQILSLQGQVAELPTLLQGTERARVVALVDKGIKLRKIRPQDRARYETCTVAALTAQLPLMPEIVTGISTEALSEEALPDKPQGAEETEAATEADEMFGRLGAPQKKRS